MSCVERSLPRSLSGRACKTTPQLSGYALASELCAGNERPLVVWARLIVATRLHES